MNMKLITSYRTLIEKARAMAKARKEGNPAEIERVEADHEAYKQLCLSADEMHIGFVLGDVIHLK